MKSKILQITGTNQTIKTFHSKPLPGDWIEISAVMTILFDNNFIPAWAERRREKTILDLPKESDEPL